MATITLDQVPVGTAVLYRPDFGDAAATVAIVTGSEANAKNGKDVVDLDNGRWAYLHQIDVVVGGA